MPITPQEALQRTIEHREFARLREPATAGSAA